MPKVHQVSPKVLACRLNGKKGGLARAKKHSKETIQEWSSKGGLTTASNHGREYYVYIQGRRKYVGRKRTPVAQKGTAVASR